jgi:hypothetical protein
MPKTQSLNESRECQHCRSDCDTSLRSRWKRCFQFSTRTIPESLVNTNLCLEYNTLIVREGHFLEQALLVDSNTPESVCGCPG